MAESTTNPEIDPHENSYEAMLETINGTIAELTDRIENGRIRDVETEKVRIQQYRALAYLIRTKQSIVEDKTLDELAEEIDELKAEREEAD